LTDYKGAHSELYGSARLALSTTAKQLHEQQGDDWNPASWLQGIAWICGILGKRDPIAEAFFHVANDLAREAAKLDGKPLRVPTGEVFSPEIEAAWLENGAKIYDLLAEILIPEGPLQ
jgi:hypothetical protein